MDPALKDPRLEGLEGEELIERGRDLAAQPLEGRERTGEMVAAAGFLVCAVAMALLLDADRSFSVPLACTLVGAHVLASRIKFEVGAGFTVPTQLVLVPMLFLLPTPVVPLFVAAGNLLGDLPDYLRGRRHPERRSWRSGTPGIRSAPALVLSRSTPQTPIEDWPIFVAALGAQITFDFASPRPRVVRARRLAASRSSRDAAWI